MKNKGLEFTNKTSQKLVETLKKENQALKAENRQAKAEVKKAKEEAEKAKAQAKLAKEEAKKAKEEAKRAKDKAEKTKDKFEELRKNLKKMKRAVSRKVAKDYQINLTPIPRYKYPLEVIKLCVLIYARVGCGLRSIRKILEIFSEVLELDLGDIPSYQNIEDWVLKLGLSVYQDDHKPEKPEKYAAIQDECIGINGEKLLLTIGIPAEFLNRPVGHADATILDMRVSKSFTGEDTKQALDDAALKVGGDPEYTITDQGTNLVKGMKIKDVTHYIDVSHAIGLCYKHEYEKQADFMELCVDLGKAHLRLQLTDSAYLLPPRLRAMARFMNLREWVKWGTKMLRIYDTLTDREQEDYAFILKYKSLFEELNTAIEVTNYVEDVLKNQGLCQRTAAICIHKVALGLFEDKPHRNVSLGFRLLDYLMDQRKKLPDMSTTVNISSDVIESTFGFFKARKSPNNLYGVTKLILMIPLYGKVKNNSGSKYFKFGERLEKVKLADVKTWCNEHLLENKVIKRNKALNKIA